MGKEYDKYNYYYRLIYEGEFKDGKKNGKGKQYYIDHDVIFEGEFLNNERWNGRVNELIHKFRKDSDDHFDFRFVGEYINGQKKGKKIVIEYYNNGNKKFEGEYLNGKKNGMVKEYYENGNLKFEGEYLYGLKTGKGKEYNEIGELTYEGK